MALPLFWLLPLRVAGPIYGLILALALATYVAALRAMRRPVRTGREELLHAHGVVLGSSGTALSVRVEGERWKAHCVETSLAPGDSVRVVGIDGLTLEVEKTEDEPFATALD